MHIKMKIKIKTKKKITQFMFSTCCQIVLFCFWFMFWFTLHCPFKLLVGSLILHANEIVFVLLMMGYTNCVSVLCL